MYVSWKLNIKDSTLVHTDGLQPFHSLTYQVLELALKNKQDIVTICTNITLNI